MARPSSPLTGPRGGRLRCGAREWGRIRDCWGSWARRCRHHRRRRAPPRPELGPGRAGAGWMTTWEPPGRCVDVAPSTHARLPVAVHSDLNSISSRSFPCHPERSEGDHLPAWPPSTHFAQEVACPLTPHPTIRHPAVSKLHLSRGRSLGHQFGLLLVIQAQVASAAALPQAMPVEVTSVRATRAADAAGARRRRRRRRLARAPRPSTGSSRPSQAKARPRVHAPSRGSPTMRATSTSSSAPSIPIPTASSASSPAATSRPRRTRST